MRSSSAKYGLLAWPVWCTLLVSSRAAAFFSLRAPWLRGSAQPLRSASGKTVWPPQDEGVLCKYIMNVTQRLSLQLLVSTCKPSDMRPGPVWPPPHVAVDGLRVAAPDLMGLGPRRGGGLPGGPAATLLLPTGDSEGAGRVGGAGGWEASSPSLGTGAGVKCTAQGISPPWGGTPDRAATRRSMLRSMAASGGWCGSSGSKSTRSFACPVEAMLEDAADCTKRMMVPHSSAVMKSSHQ
uniref:Uncharacterized protein n=1 Tax=Alexandrium monilatum TaxID=311494 RepID=A0A7S4Q3G8_9DINO